MTLKKQSPALKLYWSTGLKNGKKNFGDWLSPMLCEAISGRHIVYAKPRHCDLVACGSLYQRLNNHFWNHRVHVWGTGIIEKRTPYPTRHMIHAVRGKFTASTIINREISTLGDPGLLSDILLPEKKSVKKFRVGIIPHYVDQQNTAVIEFLKQSGVTFIDVFSETIDFLKQVDQCEMILSSSLHGLVVADSLGIPNAWLELSNLVRGEGFKFADYYSVFDLEEMQPYPFSATTTIKELDTIYDSYERTNIDQIKKNLLEAFPFR